MTENDDNGGDRKAVRVTIFGEDYLIRSEMGEAYTERCARYVDSAIQEAHVRTDRLFRAHANAEDLQRELGDRFTEMRGRIEAVLDAGD
jgi:hypothetical protein